MTCHYAILVEYDGGGFHGWQRQQADLTVQQRIEEALQALTGETTAITGAGRTDAGVHAEGQVAHFRLARKWESRRLADAVNAHLRPSRIAVLRAAEVDGEFNARTSATERCYRYRMVVRRSPLAIDEGHAWRSPVPLDAGRMREASQHLLGRHDFTTFRSAHCQASTPVRTMDSIIVSNRHDRLGQHVAITLRARSFLHRQVRSIVGSLVKVGTGSWEVGRIADILADRDRSSCGPVAPACGLCLVHVRYPRDPFLDWQDRKG